jgi:hypothetical protein
MTKKVSYFIYILVIVLGAVQLGCRKSSIPDDVSEVLTAPSNVSGVALTLTQAQVTWTNPDFVDIFYVSIEYKKTTDASFQVAESVSNLSQYTITGLTANTDYDIRLQSIDVNGNKSDYSPVVAINTGEGVMIKPTVDSISVVALPLSQIKVTWTWSNTNFELLDSYEVQRSPVGLSDWATINTINVNGTPLMEYIDNYASGGVVYRIKTNYTGGLSSYSTTSNSVDLFSLDSPNGFYTFSEYVGFGGVYYLKTKWNYGTSEDNVDFFALVSTFKREDGSIINTTTTTVNYTSAGSFTITDTDVLAIGGSCDDDDLDKIEFKVQAVPVDANENSASNWVSTTFYCP